MKDLDIIDCHTLTHQIPDTPEAIRILTGKHVAVLQYNKNLKRILVLTYVTLFGYMIYITLKPKSHDTQEETRS